MGETTHRAKIDFRVNARELQQLSNKVKEALNEKSGRVFNREMRETKKTIKESTRELDRLNNSMAKVKRGSEAWNQMRKRVSEVNKEIAKQTQELERLQRAHRKTAGARALAGIGAGGRYAARGGMAGVGIGGQAMVGGVGGLAAGMAALPIVGGMAAGAAMSAFGAYGSYMSREQAVMGAIPGLVSAQAGAVTTTRRPQAGLAQRNRDMVAAQRAALTGFIEENPIGNPLYASQRGGRRGRVQGIGDILAENRPTAYGTLNDNEIRAEIRRRRGLIEETQRAAQRQEKKVETSTKLAGMFSRQNIQQIGQRFGMTPQEAISAAGQMGMAAAQGPLAGQDIAFGLATQRRFGIGVQQTGAAMRGIRRAGGRGDSEDLAVLIGDHVARGLEASEINEALQQQTGFLEQQARVGERMSVEALALGNQRLQGAGISAFNAATLQQQIAGNVSGRFRQGGGGSPFDLMLMREMGYTGTGGAEEFAQFQLMMQDPEAAQQAAFSFGGRMGSEMRGSGMGEHMQQLVGQRVLSRALGVELGRGQASALLGMETMTAEQREAAMGRARGGAQGFMERTLAGAEAATPGVLRTQAALEAQKVGVGAEVAGAVQDMQGAALNMARSMTNLAGPVINRLASAMNDLSGMIEASTSNYELGESVP
jgi:hypothetical protein